MGPITQILFVWGIKYFSLEVESYFYIYHHFILLFNLLPIYPLDGGKLWHLILAYFISYYNSFKNIIYISFLLYCLFIFSIILWGKNLVLLLIFIVLGITLIKEMKKADYYFQRFLMERYLNQYSFSKFKKVANIKQMRRDYYHYFLEEGKVLMEQEYLKIYFS